MVKTKIEWKEEEPLIAQNRVDLYLNISTLLLLIVVHLSWSEFFWLDSLYAMLLSTITVALRVALYGLNRREEGYRLPAIIVYILAILASANLFFIIYEYEFWSLIGLDADKFENILYSAYFISAVLIALPLIELLKREYREELMDEISSLREMEKETSKKALIMLGFIGLAAIIIVVLWLTLRNVVGMNLYEMFFYVTIGGVVIVLVALVVSKKKWFIPEEGFNVNVKKISGLLIQVIVGITLIILIPIISNLIILIQEDALQEALLMVSSSFTAIMPSGAVIGQARQAPNYFSWVLFILLQDRVPALMISFMVFGAVSAMMIQNMGGVARIISGFALSITVIIPLLFIVTIITGGIPPPIELEIVLGYGTAGLVYALAQTSAFILMLAIIGVFVAGGQFLGGIMGTDK